MSSTIEFRHLAIALPVDRALAAIRAVIPEAPDFYDWGGDGNLYFVFCEAGCSNVFDRGNRVARRWHLAAVGSPYMVLRAVTRTAADYVLSGGICLHTRSRWTRPEAYIGAYRSAIESAIPFESVERAAPDLALRLSLPANPTFMEAWGAREHYRSHVRATGRLSGTDSNQTFNIAPIGTPDGVADLAWLSALGQCDFVPAWTSNDHAVNDVLDRLAETGNPRRRAQLH